MCSAPNVDADSRPQQALWQVNLEQTALVDTSFLGYSSYKARSSVYVLAIALVDISLLGYSIHIDISGLIFLVASMLRFSALV